MAFFSVFQGDSVINFIYFLMFSISCILMKIIMYMNFMCMEKNFICKSIWSLIDVLFALSLISVVCSLFLVSRRNQEKRSLRVALSVVAVDVFAFFFYLLKSLLDYGFFIAIQVFFWQLVPFVLCISLILLLYSFFFLNKEEKRLVISIRCGLEEYRKKS